MGSRLEAVRPSGLPLLNHIPGPGYAAKLVQFFPAAVILQGTRTSQGLEGVASFSTHTL
jgi:hypothetical protein